MAWVRIDNDGIVFINAAMVTEVRPMEQPHHIEVTMACGGKHKLSMDCQEFLDALGIGWVHEHEE